MFLIEGSANRDERAFTDPDCFSIDRDRNQAWNLGFGLRDPQLSGRGLRAHRKRDRARLFARLHARFDVDYDGLQRVAMTSAAGYFNVPVRTRSR